MPGCGKIILNCSHEKCTEILQVGTTFVKLSNRKSSVYLTADVSFPDSLTLLEKQTTQVISINDLGHNKMTSLVLALI